MAFLARCCSGLQGYTFSIFIFTTLLCLSPVMPLRFGSTRVIGEGGALSLNLIGTCCATSWAQ